MAHVKGYVADVSIFTALLVYGYPRAVYVIERAFRRGLQFRRAIRMKV